MQKIVFRQIVFALSVLILFFTFFFLLKQDWIYKQTLAKLGPNYAKTGHQRDARISSVYKPYSEISKETINHWDAALYNRIRMEGYSQSDRLAKEKLAFYPLFPFLWRLSHLDSFWIVIFNYLLFVFGLLVLSVQLMGPSPKRIFIYGLGLLMPSAVSYYLPYAESLFLLTMAIAVWGILSNRYGIYLIGSLLFAMTRPSALIFVVALLVTEMICFFEHRNWKRLLNRIIRMAGPPISGFLIVSVIQYLPSGSWSAYFDSMELWPTESGFFNLITDWSLEGFGMSVFSIFFIAIPALVYLIVLIIKELIKNKRKEAQDLFSQDGTMKKQYLLRVSLLFITGNLIYFALTSGNMINGFSRYTMAVPFFYIILFLLPEKLEGQPIIRILFAYALCTLGMIMFLSNVVYGNGHRFQWSNSGLFISLVLSMLFLLESYLPPKLKWSFLMLLAIPALLWHTYLFNMFLSDAWIFT